ncbi:BQ5605_C005g03594 [Microbotryum silenes-dioicae]|uniref:BQ5605_C005g03594 protein n=1 Tax=Microbotryum silenes-dioicae TaxID=796604 RepID=A0A2X0MY81_9BASI|nr:BQ5605_C005g03594 [Microbotryum silenes-dioicae]
MGSKKRNSSSTTSTPSKPGQAQEEQQADSRSSPTSSSSSRSTSNSNSNSNAPTPTPTPQSSRQAVASMGATSKIASVSSVEIPHHSRRNPKKIGYIRSWIMWYEGTLAMSMFETWEKILLHSIALIFMLFFYIAVARYLPARLRLIQERVKWYITGSEGYNAANVIAAAKAGSMGSTQTP